MSDHALLSARLSVNYPNKPGVLRDLELDISPGEILGLVGQSGCGKSTLTLAILRLLYLKGATAEKVSRSATATTPSSHYGHRELRLSQDERKKVSTISVYFRAS